jgi:hypothetical protein
VLKDEMIVVINEANALTVMKLDSFDNFTFLMNYKGNCLDIDLRIEALVKAYVLLLFVNDE